MNYEKRMGKVMGNGLSCNNNGIDSRNSEINVDIKT